VLKWVDGRAMCSSCLQLEEPRGIDRARHDCGRYWVDGE
jgi:hypothetical protein